LTDTILNDQDLYNFVQWFKRRRLICEKLTKTEKDGCYMMAKIKNSKL